MDAAAQEASGAGVPRHSPCASVVPGQASVYAKIDAAAEDDADILDEVTQTTTSALCAGGNAMGVGVSKVVLAHDYYQQRGGEDVIFETESALLRERGIEVVEFTVHNDQLRSMHALAAAGKTIWNHTIYNTLRGTLRSEQPDVIHFHNTFPLLSPSAYYAAKAEGIPVVQTINNYRLLCPGAYFMRDGRVCEDCLGKSLATNGIRHACYRQSRSATAVVASMTALHRAIGTWDHAVDVYALYLTDFARDKFIEGGLSAEKLRIKPNVVYPEPACGSGEGKYALFVGRLSPEKGIRTLLDAYAGSSDLPLLKVVGDGPLAESIREASSTDPRIEWLGQLDSEAVYARMREAKVLVFPSVWYEGLPRTIIESFASGTPVVASKLGAMSRLIAHGKTGFHFRAGDAEDLAFQLRRIHADGHEVAAMRVAARREFDGKYTAERNFEMLMEIYQATIDCQSS